MSENPPLLPALSTLDPSTNGWWQAFAQENGPTQGLTVDQVAANILQAPLPLTPENIDRLAASFEMAENPYWFNEAGPSREETNFWREVWGRVEALRLSPGEEKPAVVDTRIQFAGGAPKHPATIYVDVRDTSMVADSFEGGAPNPLIHHEEIPYDPAQTKDGGYDLPPFALSEPLHEKRTYTITVKVDCDESGPGLTKGDYWSMESVTLNIDGSLTHGRDSITVKRI